MRPPRQARPVTKPMSTTADRWRHPSSQHRQRPWGHRARPVAAPATTKTVGTVAKRPRNPAQTTRVAMAETVGLGCRHRSGAVLTAFVGVVSPCAATDLARSLAPHGIIEGCTCPPAGANTDQLGLGAPNSSLFPSHANTTVSRHVCPGSHSRSRWTGCGTTPEAPRPGDTGIRGRPLYQRWLATGPWSGPPLFAASHPFPCTYGRRLRAGKCIIINYLAGRTRAAVAALALSAETFYLGRQ